MEINFPYTIVALKLLLLVVCEAAVKYALKLSVIHTELKSLGI
jgi:hypothetical protein